MLQYLSAFLVSRCLKRHVCIHILQVLIIELLVDYPFIEFICPAPSNVRLLDTYVTESEIGSRLYFLIIRAPLVISVEYDLTQRTQS